MAKGLRELAREHIREILEGDGDGVVLGPKYTASIDVLRYVNAEEDAAAGEDVKTPLAAVLERLAELKDEKADDSDIIDLSEVRKAVQRQG